MRESGTSAIERRGYPRFAVACKARLAVPGGIAVSGVTEDVALRGVQIRCSRESAHALCPDGTLPTAVPVDLQLLIPVHGTSRRLDIQCHLVHLSLLPEEPPERRVALGLLFMRFVHGTEATFDAFLAEQMRPAE